MSRLIKCNSNGRWTKIEPSEENYYIGQIIERETWFAGREKREPMTTKKQVLNYLETGKSLSWADGWYAIIKIDIPTPETPSVEMIKCDCGHTVPKCSVMSVSTGTSCPDCYDRMSM